MRGCTDCGIEKPDTDFNTKRTYKGKINLYKYCKECHKLRRKAKAQRICYKPGCNEKLHSRGMCRPHYLKWYRDPQNIKGENKPKSVEVVHDPKSIYEGGFSKGAQFNMYGARLMLQQNYFTVGTVVRIEEKEFVVEERGDAQKFIKV